MLLYSFIWTKLSVTGVDSTTWGVWWILEWKYYSMWGGRSNTVKVVPCLFWVQTSVFWPVMCDYVSGPVIWKSNLTSHIQIMFLTILRMYTFQNYIGCMGVGVTQLAGKIKTLYFGPFLVQLEPIYRRDTRSYCNRPLHKMTSQSLRLRY